MIPLYLALGIAMISGISAMMKIGNNINNLMLLNTFNRNEEYFQSSLPNYDKRILRLLDDYSNFDSDVCSYVQENIRDIFYKEGTQSPSIESLFLGSCVLENKNIKHRVLIKKNNIGTYNMFSCYLKDERFCPFEIKE